MSNTALFALGAVWVAVFIGLFIAFAWFVLTKVAPGVNARQRRRQIKAAMQMGMFDRDAIDDISDELRGGDNR
ncbi:hypothetical protein [Streptomyces sp. NPDC051572]|uniref:hypothetical protein n=1 Tax=Streptomyces sp. NPDC051572 TaxID=3155802 RepID=UPI00344D4D52